MIDPDVHHVNAVHPKKDATENVQEKEADATMKVEVPIGMDVQEAEIVMHLEQAVWEIVVATTIVKGN